MVYSKYRHEKIQWYFFFKLRNVFKNIIGKVKVWEDLRNEGRILFCNIFNRSQQTINRKTIIKLNKKVTTPLNYSIYFNILLFSLWGEAMAVLQCQCTLQHNLIWPAETYSVLSYVSSYKASSKPTEKSILIQP
jgi:hypothetical protein